MLVGKRLRLVGGRCIVICSATPISPAALSVSVSSERVRIGGRTADGPFDGEGGTLPSEQRRGS